MHLHIIWAYKFVPLFLKAAPQGLISSKNMSTIWLRCATCKIYPKESNVYIHKSLVAGHLHIWGIPTGSDSKAATCQCRHKRPWMESWGRERIRGVHFAEVDFLNKQFEVVAILLLVMSWLILLFVYYSPVPITRWPRDLQYPSLLWSSAVGPGVGMQIRKLMVPRLLEKWSFDECTFIPFCL